MPKTPAISIFGSVQDRRFDRFGRLLFDWFRCPVLEVTVENGGRPQIKKLASVPLNKLTPEELSFFHEALHQHTRREWRSRKQPTAPRYSFAALYNPNEQLPPSDRPPVRRRSLLAPTAFTPGKAASPSIKER